MSFNQFNTSLLNKSFKVLLTNAWPQTSEQSCTCEVWQVLIFLIGPPPMNGIDENLSSASIFEHVDRMSRPTDGLKRPPNKIQLIAMQPMTALPLPSPPTNDRAPENAKHNKEVSFTSNPFISYGFSLETHFKLQGLYVYEFASQHLKAPSPIINMSFSLTPRSLTVLSPPDPGGFKAQVWNRAPSQ